MLKQCNLPKPPPPPQVQTLAGGLRVQTTHVPAECDAKSKVGQPLSMHYTGTLAATGAKFDSSRDRNQPFDFVLGAGRVIKGWDEGLREMAQGERAVLWVSSDFAYGAKGFGDTIPPNADLVYDIELLAVSPRPSDAKVKLDINHAVSLSFSHAKAAWKLVVCEIKIGLVYSLEFSVGFCGGCTPSTISNRIGQLSMASI